MDTYQRRRLAMAGRRRKARPRPHRRSPPVDPGESMDPLFGVAFGSPQARKDAEGAELTWRHFAESDVVASGKKGYLVEDVKEIIEQVPSRSEEE